MVQKERIPTIRALVDTGLVIGAVITEESVRGSWKLTHGAARFAGRQSLQAVRRVVRAADMRRDACTKTVQPIVSPEMAVANFVEALASSPDDPEHIEDKFTVLADKLESIPHVTDGIRLGAGPDGLVPAEQIARGYLSHVVSLADQCGVPPEATTPWVETLCERVGIDPQPPLDAS